MSDDSIDIDALKEPFHPKHLDYRLVRDGYSQRNDGIWARYVPYVTSRAVQERLDSIIGPERWRDEYRAGPAGGVICRISIRLDDGTWVGKEDGASNTNIEEVKGGISGAFKRAAVKWGVGRYLYRVEERRAIVSGNPQEHTYFATCKHNGQETRYSWSPQPLQSEFLPDGVDQNADPRWVRKDGGYSPDKDQRSSSEKRRDSANAPSDKQINFIGNLVESSCFTKREKVKIKARFLPDELDNDQLEQAKEVFWPDEDKIPPATKGAASDLLDWMTSARDERKSSDGG